VLFIPAAVSDYPSRSPSVVSSDAPSKVSLLVGAATSAAPSSPGADVPASGTAMSDAPSLVPSVAQSDTPSNVPFITSVVPTLASTTSDITSDFPSSQPSLGVSHPPSFVPLSSSSQPSSLFSQQGFPDSTNGPTSGPTTSTGAVKFQSRSTGLMDNETVAIFEDVVGQQYLPQVLPLIHAANYTQTKCKVISQSLLLNNSRRMLQGTSSGKQTAKLMVTTDNVKILLRISSNVDPPASNFNELVASALQEYPQLLQQLLGNQTTYFRPVGTNANTTTTTNTTTIQSNHNSTMTHAPVAAIEATSNSNNTSKMPVIIIVAAVVGGVVVALLAAFLLGKRDAYRPPTDAQLPDGCSILFSDTQGDVYPFGHVAESGRGGLMIQTSFSSISGSNLPLSSSPGPYPLLTPLNLQTGSDGHQNLSPLSVGQIQAYDEVSPVASSRFEKSPIVSPLSVDSATSPKSAGAATSPLSRASSVSPRSNGSASSVNGVIQILEQHINKYNKNSEDCRQSMQSDRNQSSVAGNVKRQGTKYTTTTFSEEAGRNRHQNTRYDATGISERVSEESSWEREGKTSSDEESNHLNGLDYLYAVEDSTIQRPSQKLVVETVVSQDTHEAKTKGRFNFLNGNGNKGDHTTSPVGQSQTESISGPIDSLASFLSNDEDSLKQATQPSLQTLRATTATTATKPAKPLTINTKHASHTESVLDDLGDMEEEWKGQLDSTTTTTSTTPRSENRERFRKPPRNILYDGRILNDGTGDSI
jgi:hypothetical protein